MTKLNNLNYDKIKNSISKQKNNLWKTSVVKNNVTPWQPMRCFWGSHLRSRNVFFSYIRLPSPDTCRAFLSSCSPVPWAPKLTMDKTVLMLEGEISRFLASSFLRAGFETSRQRSRLNLLLSESSLLLIIAGDIPGQERFLKIRNVTKLKFVFLKLVGTISISSLSKLVFFFSNRASRQHVRVCVY